MTFNKLSKNGATFIRLHEGFVGKWYLDPVGVATIGTGFTMRSVAFRKWWKKNKPGVLFKRGATMTRAEADDALKFLVDEEYGKAVNEFLNKKVSQNVYDGMVSFAYNAGPGSLKWKWALAIKSGDIAEAVKRMKVTAVTAKGKKLPGLVRRRKEEALLVSHGIYTGIEFSEDSPTQKPSAISDGILARGEAGPEVAELIENLRELGFYTGEADDKYGFGTEAAVLKYQRIKGLKADGKAGPKTLRMIRIESSVKIVPVKNPDSKILPLFRPKQSDLITRLILDKFKNLTPEKHRDENVKVLFVRGYYRDSMGAKGRNDRKIYDDAIFVSSPEGVQSFNGNSDPSVYRENVASLETDQSINYKPGLHGYSRKAGPYPAFRQNSDVKVIRDQIGKDKGMFHINLHRGGVNGTSSLGCLTVPPHQWGEFYGLVKGLLKRYNQPTFNVTLIEYDGDNPPVKGLEDSKPALSVGVSFSIMILIYSWWAEFSMWFKGFFQ